MNASGIEENQIHHYDSVTIEEVKKYNGVLTLKTRLKEKLQRYFKYWQYT